jgi:hypothetical protein
MRIPDVVRYQTLEFFLPGRVPQLEAVDRSLIVYILDHEINADCLLHEGRGTALLASKRSWMKR